MQSLNCSRPYHRKDMLENIKTKLIPGHRDNSYEERLRECGLTILDTRLLRGVKYTFLRYYFQN